MASKTWKERILNAATKENSINNPILRKRFRIPQTEMNQSAFNDVVMRTVRGLNEEKALKRVNVGEYKITKKGEKMLDSYQYGK